MRELLDLIIFLMVGRRIFERIIGSNHFQNGSGLLFERFSDYLVSFHSGLVF